jgi:hypothetical protein
MEIYGYPGSDLLERTDSLLGDPQSREFAIFEVRKDDRFRVQPEGVWVAG